ncbi:ricin-type beta-trefoil lectin domain protein [Kitasatospora sp. NPDC006697]|uniref:ricin-type beta-trefoil lectin domain protein n=1 Tax=Kitasatospora sp. NPDC006697 TaxID=3364020 RepID=UPI0036AB5EEB
MTSANLIVNGDAESGPASGNGNSAVPIPGWTVTQGVPVVVAYGTSGFPSAGSPGSPTRGAKFFAGGNSGSSALHQSVDISASAGSVDAGTATYNLSGWLGGWQGDNDRAALVATFADAAGNRLGSAQIGPVTWTDRNSVTEFLQRSAVGTVPAGARSIALDLQMTQSWGYDDGYADGLSLTLTTGSPRSANLVLDPGGESASCTNSGKDGTTVPGWTVTAGEPDVICYATPNDFPHPGTPGSPNRGNAFFAGGATGSSNLRQTVDVSTAAAAIDQGGTTFDLSGWLGGYGSQNDRAALTATFRNGAGASLGTGQIGPVTDADRNEATSFLLRDTTGAVPAGTRSIQLDLSFTYSYGDTTDGYADDLSLTLSTPVAAPVLAVPPSSTPAFDHVFFAFMENENYQDVIGSSTAPYINGTLLPKGTLLSNSYALTHPSDPNYLAASGGSTFGWSSSPTVGSDKIDAPNLGDTADAAGKTWKGYAGGMSGNCDTSYHDSAGGGYYLPDDEPFMMYKDVIDNPSRCAAHNQPLTRLTTDLQSAATTPNFVWFAANDYDDMEIGTRTDGDNWLRSYLPNIFNSPAWTQQRSLLILSWDEAYDKAYGPSEPNHVVTLMIGSQNTVKPGYTSTTRVDHYSMLRTVDEALGLNPLTNNDKYATPANDVWNHPGPLVGAGSGRCLDAGGSPATIQDCNGGSSQQWTATSANTLTAAGTCLDASGGGTSPGTPVIPWNCNGGANQQWTFAADDTIRGAQSGLCLDVTGAGTGNGTPVELWTCNGGSNQLWQSGR